MSGSFSTTFPECETGTCLRVRLASLYMECAQLLQLFSELRSAGRAIEAARVLLGVDVRFDAVVGRRMRYQDFKPLLVVRALVSTAAPPLADTDQSGSGEPNAESPSNVPHIEALLDVLDDTDTDAYTSDAVTGAGASSAADSRMRPEFARWLSESHVLAADEQQVATAASAQMPRVRVGVVQYCSSVVGVPQLVASRVYSVIAVPSAAPRRISRSTTTRCCRRRSCRPAAAPRTSSCRTSRTCSSSCCSSRAPPAHHIRHSSPLLSHLLSARTTARGL